jgi:predicted nucleic acid-binding protein
VIRAVLLDSGPLGLVTNPNLSNEGVDCTKWLQSLLSSNVRVIIPEIVDYEIRRELLRANKTKGLNQLDSMIALLEYLPITTTTMRQAALFRAQARRQGQPTAGDNTIDGDMILAAQAFTLGVPDVVIATTNIGHLSQFASAELWQLIDVSLRP